MKQLGDWLAGNALEILRSPHTSGAGLVAMLCALGEVWLPQYQAQFHKTREVAVSYGLVMASQIKRQNGDKTLTAENAEKENK